VNVRHRKPFWPAAALLLLASQTMFAWLSAAEPIVSARPLEGESVSGRLVELEAARIKLSSGDTVRELEPSKLMWLDFLAPAAAQKPSVWIDFLDGSRAFAISYVAHDGRATIGLATGQLLEVSTRSIRTVRFKDQSSELAFQWREITTATTSADLIVTRKSSTRTIEQGENESRTVTEQALDQLEGTIHEVTPDVVRFEIDGEKVPIRREKLEGLVYYQPARRDFSSPLCRLHDAGGSTWLVRDAKLAGNRLSVTTLGNLSLELPLNALAKLDYSVGNVAFLSDLEPDSGGGEISVSLQPAAMSTKFSRVFQVRNRPPLGTDSFRIGGERFENGLSLHSPLKLVYRVPEGFKKLQATVGVDDSVVGPGHFTLIVLGDGKELARHAFTAETPRQPQTLQFDVASIRRITIVLESADGQDIGDQLNFCEARFTK
jgi:hypothetical protein